MDALRIGIVGLGTVGSGVAHILRDHAERNALRAGKQLIIHRVAVRDINKPRGVDLPQSMLTEDPLSITTDPDIDVVVELMGGVDLASKVVRSALANRKHVVTANKALICQYGPELFQLARENDRTICFEAAVAGGCPIIAAIGQAMAGNQITSLQAIINGTSNFILTQMFHQNVSYDDAVREAQEIGYAEADPAMDVEGTDAAQKLGILTQLAFGTSVTPDHFPVQGINTLALDDLKYADELGYAIKLLATAKLVEGRLELHTQPTLIRHQRPIAQVDGPYNMIELTGDAVGKAWFSAMGAGQMATASAVVADIIDLAIGRAQLTFQKLDLWGGHPPVSLQPAEEIERRYYFRFTVEDRPHVIADIADVLGRNEISLASIIQKEAPETDELAAGAYPIVPLMFMTHRTREGLIRKAAEELKNLSCVTTPWVCLPVAD
ncbi:MAG: homoserine dehydrogenase [Planctomycetaceae bacterium]|nr:homoserine dehydrogenase [Planctomycetaceae bacterium]MCB9950630.1 homoserine dehydrogenase [Planctomycetaceae bacterium]